MMTRSARCNPSAPDPRSSTGQQQYLVMCPCLDASTQRVPVHAAYTSGVCGPRRRRRRPLTRGLNRNHNRVLKNVFKGAANAATGGLISVRGLTVRLIRALRTRRRSPPLQQRQRTSVSHRERRARLPAGTRWPSQASRRFASSPEPESGHDRTAWLRRQDRVDEAGHGRPAGQPLRSSPDLCVKAEEAPRLRLGCLGDLLFLEE